MFSDEDLRRLKERNPLQIKGPELVYLLARMEAAELAMRHFMHDVPKKNFDKCATYQAWRKACGL